MKTELEQVRRNPPARASSLDDPDEWTITEDGFRFGKGDLVFNYYDCEWLIVAEDPTKTYGGWFSTKYPGNGISGPCLNSVRVSANLPPWANAEKYPKPQLHVWQYEADADIVVCTVCAAATADPAAYATPCSGR